MDFLKGGMGTLRRQSSNKMSEMFQSSKPKTPREIFYLYNDQFGFPPKEPKHLVKFAKAKDYILKYKKAEELLNDPPNPPKKRLENGGFEWSDSDSSFEDDDDDDDDDDYKQEEDMNDYKKDDIDKPIINKTKTKNVNKNKDKISRKHNISELKRTQLIVIIDIKTQKQRDYMHMFNINASQNDTDNDNDDDAAPFYDECGYSITPLTNNIIIDFHLDISFKQWPKSSRTFLGALHDLLLIKRRDYNILTVCKKPDNPSQLQISILLRKCPKSKSEMQKALAPLTKSFKDSTHLLKMLKKLQFNEIDTTGKNQVDRNEFNLYFEENSVEPLDPQVLINLFNTLDADGDGEITLLEFFKWKTTFSINKLTSMFPIIECKIQDDIYKYCANRKLYLQLTQIQKHCYTQLQDFPFELDLIDMFSLNNHQIYKKYDTFKGQSKLLFLMYRNGIGIGDINDLLKRGLGKKGKYFDDKGMYGQGYYFTSDIQYALSNMLYYNEQAEHPTRGHHVQQLSSMDQSQSRDFSHGEFCIMVCLVNPGKINYIREFQRGKKIKSADSNCVMRLIGDWNEVDSSTPLFGRPESHYESQHTEHSQYYDGHVYDCYVIKNYQRILPRLVLSFKRIKQCFIWMDEKLENIDECASKLIFNRNKLRKYMPNIIYGGDNKEFVIKLVRLKMKYNSVFLLRFVGINVSVSSTMGHFIKYIRGNIENVAVKIYPITIIYNVTTKKQLWNLILRDDQQKKLLNVRGSAKQVFKYIADNLGKNTGRCGCVSVVVMSIKFIRKQKTIKTIVKQQIEDTKNLQQEFDANPNYYFDKVVEDEYKYTREDDSRAETDEKEEKKTETKAKTFTIQITGADGNKKKKEKEQKVRMRSEAEKMKQMLDSETIDKLLALDLPPQVSAYLGSPTSYQLEEKESMANLERDMRKMHQGLHGQSANQRKYSKLAILKHYNCLCAIYGKYCKLGGDRHWLTLDGFLWMLSDAYVADKDGICTNERLEQLFKITYKMHHRLKTKHQSKHKIQLSSLYGDINFNDVDPWTGVWTECASFYDKNSNSNSNSKSKPSTPTASTPRSGFIYKLRKIGDLRLSGCINNIQYADISGTFDSLNYKKSELEIKYHQRKRAGIKRIWSCELIPPGHIMDNIKMKIEWTEIDERGKGGSQQKSDKLFLQKTDKLLDNDRDLPKDQMIGLSRYEFFDAILSISMTKFELDYEYQFICVDKLCNDHFDAYLYRNIMNNNVNAIRNNQENKKLFKKQTLVLRKLFKIYACLDSDENADDDRLGEDEWCTFAVAVCKTMKSLKKKIWSQGGKPTFNEMQASFRLSKNEMELDDDEIDYILFEKCIVNLTNIMFKQQPNTKYKILPFKEKLDLVFSATDKMNIATNLKKRDSVTFKKIKLKSGGGSPRSSNALPTSFNDFPIFNPGNSKSKSKNT